MAENHPLLPLNNAVVNPMQNQVYADTPLMAFAKSGNWEKLIDYLNREVEEYKDITEGVDETGKTILHHACQIGGNKNARARAEQILKFAELNVDENDEIKKFVDKADNGNKSAIHYAIEAKNKKLIMLILSYEADVNLPENGGENEAIQQIYSKVPTVLLDLFEKGLTLEEDEEDDSSEMWNVKWDFTPVTGVNDKKMESQTKMLSNVLRQKKLKRSEVLCHPLVQLFLYYKHEKFTRLIQISIAYHIIWSITSILFICAIAPFPKEDSGNATNTSELESHKNYEIIRVTGLWIFIALYALLYAFTFVKELVEFFSCPDIKYYARQLENAGQWILLFSVLVVGIFTLIIDQNACGENEVCIDWMTLVAVSSGAIGILISGFLILGQFNKTERLGIYIEMLAKVTKKVFFFAVIFAPLLLTFALVFHLLMPAKEDFQFPYLSKMLSMMIGELTHDELLNGDDKDDAIPYPVLARMIFIVFIVVATIVLSNLLIGLTLSDIQELNKKAEENHYAKLLEEIYLIENFLHLPKLAYIVKFINMLPIIGFKLEDLMVPLRGSKRSGQDVVDNAEDDENGTKFEKLPKKPQNILMNAVREKPDRLKKHESEEEST